MPVQQALSGDVTITLDGEDHILRPSLQATTAISAEFDGLSGAYQAVLSRNVGAYIGIVKAGIVTGESFTAKQLAEAVFRAGMKSLSKPLLDFLGVLNNGGRATDDDEDEGKAKAEAASGNDAA